MKEIFEKPLMVMRYLNKGTTKQSSREQPVFLSDPFLFGFFWGGWAFFVRLASQSTLSLLTVYRLYLL